MQKKLQKNPYPGLRPFEFAENHLFFGREGQSEEVLRRLCESHFVAVVGTSGSGKSSLVRAGLLPLLYGGYMPEAGASWRVALFRPGDNPIHNLAEALVRPAQFSLSNAVKKEEDLKLAKNEEALKLAVTETVLRRSAVGLRDYANSSEFAEDENLLVVVDQFEELFRFKKEKKSQLIAEKSETQEKAENEAAAFVKLLLEAAGDKAKRVYVIITMRSDFLGDCSQFRDLPETINNGQYLIPRLTSEQLRKAVESPAKVKGAKIQPALVARLLNDIGDDQDQLPVLQHALMRTWDEWAKAGDKQIEIGFEHYNTTGGMATALSLHADEAFFELGDGDSENYSSKQKIAEKLFKCLTETDRENRETRRATSLGKICAIADAEQEEVIEVIEIFRQPGRTFLMPPQPETLGKDTLIDISHESLIRKWERLKKWVEEEAQSAQTYRRLAEDALLNKKKKVGFWSDPELADALEWKENFKPNETWAELYSKTWGNRYLSTYPEAIDYLEASKTFRENELAEEEAQRNKDLEQERKLREQAELLIVASERETKDAQALALEKERIAEIEIEKAQALEKSAKKLKKFIIALAAMSLLFFAVAASAIYFAYESKSNARTAKEKELEAIDSELVTIDALRKTERLNTDLINKSNELNDKKIELEGSLEKQEKATKKAEEQTNLAEKQTNLAEEQTNLAEKQTLKAKQNEEEKQIALEEQERLKLEAIRDKANAEIAAANAKAAELKAIETADRESLNRTALTLLEQGENKKAKDVFIDLIRNYNDIDEPVNDPSYDPGIKKNGLWWSLHNLGIANARLRRFSDAATSYQEALRIIGEPQDNDGEILKSQSQNANVFFQQRISYQVGDKESRSKITTLRRLAQLYREIAQSNVSREEIALLYPEIVQNDASSEKISLKFNLLAIKKYNRLRELLRNEPRDTKLPSYPAEVSIELADIYSSLSDQGLTDSNFSFLELGDKNLYEKAKQLYEEAAKSYRDEKNFAKVVFILKKQADVAVKRKLDKEAVEFLEEATSIQENELNLPLFSLELSESYSKLANSYNKLAKPIDSPNQTNSETEIADSAFLSKEYEEQTKRIIYAVLSKYYEEQAKRIIDLNYQSNNSYDSEVDTLIAMADAYSKKGICSRAEKIYDDAVEKIKQISESDRLDYEIKLLESRGYFYRNTNQNKAKKEKVRKEFFEKIENRYDEFIIGKYYFLSVFINFYVDEGEYDSAIAEYEKVLQRVRYLKDTTDDPQGKMIDRLIQQEVTVTGKLADAYDKKGNEIEAEKKYIEADRIYKEKFGNEHSATYLKLADFYFRRNKADTAKAIYEETSGIYEKLVNSNAENYTRMSKNFNELGFYIYSQINLGKIEEKNSIGLAKDHYSKAIKGLDIYNSILTAALKSNPSDPPIYGKYHIFGKLNAEYYKDRADVLESWSKLVKTEEADSMKAQAIEARKKEEELTRSDIEENLELQPATQCKDTPK